MRKLLKSFKTEINPTVEQKIKINKTIGTCRYIYNFYLAHNKELYANGERFMTGKGFSVWLNNEYIPNNPEKVWIKEAYSKAVKSLLKMDILHLQDFLNIKVLFLISKRKVNLV